MSQQNPKGARPVAPPFGGPGPTPKTNNSHPNRKIASTYQPNRPAFARIGRKSPNPPRQNGPPSQNGNPNNKFNHLESNFRPISAQLGRRKGKGDKPAPPPFMPSGGAKKPAPGGGKPIPPSFNMPKGKTNGTTNGTKAAPAKKGPPPTVPSFTPKKVFGAKKAPPPSLPPFEIGNDADDDDDDAYLFELPDDADNIVFIKDTLSQPRPEVRGGILEKLVQRLTYEKYPDPDFTKTFLLTYRSFTTPTELLALLIQRYQIPRPKGTDIEDFIANRENPIRLRVFNILLKWVKTYFYDFEADRGLVDTLLDFISNHMLNNSGKSMVTAGTQLKRVVYRQLEGNDKTVRDFVWTSDPPPSILPPDFSKSMSPNTLNVYSFSPVEVARQLTLIEYTLFANIKPWECLNQAWTKKATRDEKAPNILTMIQRFNQVSRWVASEIVKVEQLKQRTSVLEFFIEVALGCKELNNYNGIMEIVSGMQSSSVYRLKQTWGSLSKSKDREYESIRTLMAREQNFHSFRTHLHNVDPPCIPYLGVYLTDLTFVEDGNKDFLPENPKLINFVKRRKIAHVIREIQQYQQTPYCLHEVTPLKEFLSKVKYLDEEECYKASTTNEPKIKGGAAQTKSKKSRTLKFGKKKKSSYTPKSKRSTTQSTAADNNEKEEEEEEDFGELDIPEGYPFAEKDSNQCILFDTDSSLLTNDTKQTRTIKAATIEKLVERVTHQSVADPAMVNTFLQTYTVFTTPAKLAELLFHRFQIPEPKNKDATLLGKYQKTLVVPVRLRVFNLAKIWVERYFHRCREDEKVHEYLKKLADGLISSGMKSAGETLIRSLKREKSGEASLARENRVRVGTPPAPILPKGFEPDGSKQYSLMDFTPLEIARQICLKEHKLFAEIAMRELLEKNWVKKEKNELSPNVVIAQEHHECMKRWVASSIARQDYASDAAKCIARWIKIAEKLLHLNNFNGVVEIITALQSPEIAKLNLVWKAVSGKNTFNKLKALIQKQGNLYNKLQDKLHNSQPPCVPYIDAYLLKLIEIDTKYPSLISRDSKTGGKKRKLINFEKWSFIASVMAEIKQFQQCLYCLEEVPLLAQWFDDAEMKKNSYSDEEMNERTVMLLVNVPKKGNDDADASLSSSKAAKLLGMDDTKDSKKKRKQSVAESKEMSKDRKKGKGKKGKIERTISDAQLKKAKRKGSRADVNEQKDLLIQLILGDDDFRNRMRSALMNDVLVQMESQKKEIQKLKDEVKKLKKGQK